MFNRKIELKIACVEKGIKLYELAEKLGVTPDYIYQVIGGVGNLSYIKQVEASQILGIPREILFK